MQVKELLTDDDAVSPVIGVILMVAITVILAAVIAAFVLGLGDTSDPGPQVSFDYDFDEDAPSAADGTLDITVSSGDSFEAGLVSFEGTGFNQAGDAFSDLAQENVSAGDSSGFAADSVVSAGARATLGDVKPDFELDITFTSEDGGDSSIISTRTGPDA